MNRGVSSVFEQCTICPQGEQKYCGDARPGAGGRGALLLQEQGALQVNFSMSALSLSHSPPFLPGYVSLGRPDLLLAPLDSSSPWWRTGASPGTADFPSYSTGMWIELLKKRQAFCKNALMVLQVLQPRVCERIIPRVGAVFFFFAIHINFLHSPSNLLIKFLNGS